jgi:hypothetical protein
MLYLTSFAFAGCSFHALAIDEFLLGFLFMLQFGCSCIYHSHYTRPDAFYAGHLIGNMDKLLARVIWFWILYGTHQFPWSYVKLFVFFCLAYIPVVYFTFCKHFPYYKPFEISYYTWMHGSMHIVACIGTHAYLWTAFPERHRALGLR